MKKILIPLLVVLILLIAGFASRQISARMIIDNSVALNRRVESSSPSISSAPFAGFEIGDAIFRNNHFPTPPFLKHFNWVGHDGIYWYWVPDEKSDPTIKANHITMEEMRCKWDWRNPFKLGHLDFGNFEKFSVKNDVWGVGAHKLYYKKRQQLIKTAEAQTNIHPRYAFRKGYKSPGRSFRCDGFVEWSYESVGVDIVPNDWWRSRRRRTGLTPALQFWNSSARIGKFQKLHFGTEEKPNEPIYIDNEPVPLEDGKYKVYGEEVEIKIYASDLDDDDDGSGITRLELWVGEIDDTPDEMPGLRLMRDDADYPADNDYTYIWDTTKKEDGEPLFPDGDYTLKTIAFDQAGNYTEAEIQVEVVNEGQKYLHVSVIPAYVETDESNNDRTETFNVSIEVWNFGVCAEEDCSPEGCVPKKEGTQSWEFVDGKWQKETCCTNFEIELYRRLPLNLLIFFTHSPEVPSKKHDINNN